MHIVCLYAAYTLQPPIIALIRRVWMRIKWGWHTQEKMKHHHIGVPKWCSVDHAEYCLDSKYMEQITCITETGTAEI